MAIAKLLVSACALSALLVGCSQESQEKYGEAGQQIKQAAKNTGEAIEKDTKVATEATKAAAQTAQQSFEKSAANDVLTTGKVKAALMATKDLNSKGINVETANGKVVLKGAVPTDAQKALASQVAADRAGDKYKVDNQLTVNKQ